MNSITHADLCVNGSGVRCGLPKSQWQHGQSSRLLAGNATLHARRTQLLAQRGDCADPQSKQSSAAGQGGWLGSLHAVLREHGAADAPPAAVAVAPASSQTPIRIQPDIARMVLRRGLAAPARIWLLARHLDTAGSGWLTVNALRAALCDKESPLRICGWRRLRQLLHSGSGQFWRRDDRGRLWLFGTQRVGQRLGLNKLKAATVTLPQHAVCGTIGTLRAHLHATFHAARNNSSPISRAAIEQATHVPSRTQQHYDACSGTQRSSNISVATRQTATNRQPYAARHGQAAFTFQDTRGAFGRINATYNARRLPNSYQSPLRCQRSRSIRRHNRRLRTLVDNWGQGHSQPYARHFFTDAKQALRSQRRETTSYLQLANSNLWTELRVGSL